MMEKGTAVIISPVHWHFTWQTAHHVARGLARSGYRVYFIEPIPKRWPGLGEARRVWGRLSGRSHLAGMGWQPVPAGICLISPITLPDVGPLAQFLNRKIFIPRLARQLGREGIQRPLIVIHHVPIPAAVALQKELAPDAAFYRCVHDWSNDPHSQRHFDESELLRHVDLTWADCRHNLERVHAFNPRVKLMPPAVDLALFHPLQKETIQPPNDPPLCVYFGSVGANVDVELLRQVSHRYPLRLIGPVKVSLDDFSPATDIVGPVPHDELPRHLTAADILLLPYGESPHVQGLIPAKLYESLATGKPIVASGLTTIDHLRDLIYLCDTHEAFFVALERARHESPALREARLAAARANSWSRRMEEMLADVETVLQEGKERRQ
jgi:glycosyltransferase involved in cell wall biosynthesis